MPSTPLVRPSESASSASCTGGVRGSRAASPRLGSVPRWERSRRGHGEHVVQHEREPLGGSQRSEYREQRETDRVAQRGLMLGVDPDETFTRAFLPPIVATTARNGSCVTSTFAAASSVVICTMAARTFEVGRSVGTADSWCMSRAAGRGASWEGPRVHDPGQDRAACGAEVSRGCGLPGRCSEGAAGWSPA